MADSRRWDASSGRRRDDQFVRPPSFRDGVDSAPLSPESATWHGSGSRGVAFAAALAVLAGLAAVAFMQFASPVGTQPHAPDAPLGAEGDGAAAGLAAPEDLDVPGAAGNATRTLPPLPTLPPTPG